jgi:hypothetical protein
MQNIDMTVDKYILTIKIDLSQRHGESASGKTIIIASTSGNIAVPGNKEIKIGINAYIKNQDYKGE